MTIIVFVGGFSLLEGVGIEFACTKAWNDFKTNVFEVNSLIVITSVHFPSHQVLAFSSTRAVRNSSTRSTSYLPLVTTPGCSL